MGCEGGLDLSQFDTVPVDLDLAVLTAEELDNAFGVPTAPVAGAVQALIGAWVDEELTCGDLGRGMVTLSQACAGEIELAVHTGAAFTKILVKDVDRLVRQGSTVGYGNPCRCHLVDLVEY